MGSTSLDDAILALGPHAVEPAVFTFNYDYGQDEGFFGVGPSNGPVAGAESRHALENIILPAISSLTSEDAGRLIARLVGPVE